MRDLRDTLFLVCLSLSLFACGDDETAPPPAPIVPPVSTVEPPPVPTPPVAPPSPSIPRADVDALLATWLDAQNRGDFDAYAPLYAGRFEGVRRTERETFRLDHDGWIEDRRRLFGRPMEVSTRDVEVVLTPTTAIVRFTQRWASGRYVEEGPKRMVLVREGGALRIASEEMIAAHAVPRAATLGAVLSAFDTQASTIIVLGETTEPGEGAPRDVPTDGMRVAMRDAGPSIPAAFAALSGQPVQLVGDTGVCSARIGSLGVAAIVRPHFGAEQHWQGEDFDESTPAVLTPTSQIALEVDAMAEHHYWVAIADRSTCGHAHAAVPGDRAPVRWPLRPEAPAAEPILALVLAGDTRQELVTELREGRDAMGEPVLDDAALEATLRSSAVIREHAQTEGTSVIEVRIPIPGECGGHERAFLLTRTAGVLARRDLAGWHAIEGVVDLEGDGTPELLVTDDLGDTRRISRLASSPETLAEWWISDFDCGC